VARAIGGVDTFGAVTAGTTGVAGDVGCSTAVLGGIGFGGATGATSRRACGGGVGGDSGTITAADDVVSVFVNTNTVRIEIRATANSTPVIAIDIPTLGK
jgi:hypothetical protein